MPCDSFPRSSSISLSASRPGDCRSGFPTMRSGDRSSEPRTLVSFIPSPCCTSSSPSRTRTAPRSSFPVCWRLSERSCWDVCSASRQREPCSPASRLRSQAMSSRSPRTFSTCTRSACCRFSAPRSKKLSLATARGSWHQPSSGPPCSSTATCRRAITTVSSRWPGWWRGRLGSIALLGCGWR